ncbi:hypothetical protein AMECASPLE_037250 [Ameca splendens]|uniref:Uncharacterized protein n=1 Tax=Ameca splendens TaxID=208324 RepID=A0ABV0XKW2_9TELE
MDSEAKSIYEGTLQTVRASTPTTHRHIPDMGYNWQSSCVKPVLNIQRILSAKRTKLFSGPKSSFQMKVNFAFHLEIKVWRKSRDVRKLRSSVRFPVGDDLRSHVIHWSLCIVFYQVQSQCSRLPANSRDLL